MRSAEILKESNPLLEAHGLPAKVQEKGGRDLARIKELHDWGDKDTARFESEKRAGLVNWGGVLRHGAVQNLVVKPTDKVVNSALGISGKRRFDRHQGCTRYRQ